MIAFRHLAAAVTLALGVLAMTGAARAEMRALVIGNAAYQHGGQLANPGRDADAFSAFLAKAGFTVTKMTDLRRSDMGAAITAFADTLRSDDTVVFYYSGHGLQMEGENYLVGVEAQLRNSFDVPAEAVGLTPIIDLLEKRARVSLVFIDACRNNPLIETLAKDATRAVTRGLAPLHSEGDGAMVAFAAAPGQVAFDGVGDNSPFTMALIAHLAEPGVEVGTAFKRVIRDVRDATLNRQSPQLVSSLSTEVYLGGELVPLPPAAAPAPSAPATVVSEAPAAVVRATPLTLSASPVSSAPVLAPLGTPVPPTPLGVVPKAETVAPATNAAGLAPISVPFIPDAPAPVPEPVIPAPVPAPEPAPPPKPVDVAELEFGRAQQLRTPRVWQLFLAKHPRTAYSERAAFELAKLSTGNLERRGQTPAQIEAGLTLSKPTRVLVQEALSRSGFDPGTPDGAFGPGTRGQIAAFQTSVGLKSTGYVTVETIIQLGIPIGVGRVADTSGPLARTYRSNALDGIESDPRLLKALKVLQGEGVIYGFFGGHLYIAVRNAPPYDAAQARARAAGGYLASITSADENAFVYGMVREDTYFMQPYTHSGDSFVTMDGPMIGYHLAPDGKRWVWDSGETSKYTAWGGNQPDNYQGRENAAHFWHQLPRGVKPGNTAAYKPTWNDAPDRGGTGFIIEIE